MNVDLRHGDCVELMRAMPDCSVDSIVTDPPYGLEFMGKDWDAPWKAKPSKEFNEIESGTLGGFSRLPNHSRVNNVRCEACQRWKFSSNPCDCDNPKFPNARLDALTVFQQWFTEVAAEALRVLKPGGHLLAFGGTRTYHRMACAIEDAGFEIRDSIHWVYGSGFPKSHNIGKNIDKHLNADRQPTGEVRKGGWRPGGNGGNLMNNAGGGLPDIVETVAATDEARRWEGWGTALKPAHEPVVVARKPLQSTVAGNVLEWGTGGLNIDGCRVAGVMDGTWGATQKSSIGYGGTDVTDYQTQPHAAGRWPANVVFDRTAGEALDQQSGERPSAGEYTHSLSKPERPWAPFGGMAKTGQAKRSNKYHGETGGASRFFTQADWGPDDWPFVYQAKPSRKERNAGLDGLPERSAAERYETLHTLNADNQQRLPASNHHPTVKPVALMRHLVRLVTPPGGVVLDPFAGSGTTLVAAVLEGMNAVGCEMTEEYLPIIRGRVEWAQAEAEARAEAAANPEQPTLL